MFDKSVHAARVLLGLQYVLSGLNWWIKILPFPSLSDGAAFAHKHAVAAAMIATGWMFGLSKLIELATGMALLANRFVPLALVVSMPVALTTFLLDAFIGDALIGWMRGEVAGAALLGKILDLVFFGVVVLALQAYLMFAYLKYYRPMLQATTVPEWPMSPVAAPLSAAHRSLRSALILLGGIAIALGVIGTLWYLGMIRQWLIPWSSLRILALGALVP